MKSGVKVNTENLQWPCAMRESSNHAANLGKKKGKNKTNNTEKYF